MKKQNDNSNIVSFTKEEGLKVLEYWTSERKMNANPLSNEENLKELNNSLQYNETNPVLPSDLKFTDSFLGRPYPANLKRSPYDCGGKFFLTKVTGGTKEDFVASAQFVGHQQMILTAAHAVRERGTGNYYENLLFIHGYEYTTLGGEKGTPYLIQRVLTPDEFINTKEATGEYDYAFCRVNKGFTKYLGFGLNRQGGKGTPLLSMGYPHNYNGGYLMNRVDGTTGETYEKYFLMENNPMGKGCSGGAIMTDLILGDTPFKDVVVGINSVVSLDGKKIVRSPIFNQQTMDIFHQVLNSPE
ncbi:trypsin-like serine peptidase [Bacillus cereus]|uniref:trypsin-like serine peptidase n=1 Tax=Bacillus cereus TaxID=1396 RepID=UPI000BFB5A2F|nr:serine protease [Bacillus cereus]PGU52816.1 hypothetical protein COD72_20690 [Bacillus cereus]